MRKIIRAEYAGFCFGVRQAIEKAEEAARNLSLIHICRSSHRQNCIFWRG